VLNHIIFKTWETPAPPPLASTTVASQWWSQDPILGGLKIKKMKISAKIKIHNVKLCSMGGGGKAPISLSYSVLLPNQILILCMSRNKVFTHTVQKMDIE
jgi:hypothetical protein